MSRPMNTASRTPPTTMARIGMSVDDLTGARRGLALPPRTCALAPRTVGLDLLPEDATGIDRIPTYPFWPRPGQLRSDGPRPEPIGRRMSPLRDYEVLYIVRADLDDDKVQDAVKRVNTLIERSGGTIERTNLWGKRKLAYEVKHQKEGAYVLQDFQLDPTRVPELEAGLKITGEAWRHLVVRRPEKVVATAVTPPPAEVVQEPVASEPEAVVGRVREAVREEET